MYLFISLFIFCFDLLLILVHLQVESVTLIVVSASICFGIPPPTLLRSATVAAELQPGFQLEHRQADEPGEMLQHEHPSLNNLRCYFCGFPIDCLRKSLFNRLQRCRMLQTPRASADSINPPACGEIFKGNKGKSYLSSLWFHTERWRVPVSFCDSSVHVSCFSIRQTHDTEISSLIKAATNKAVGLSGYFRISPHVFTKLLKVLKSKGQIKAADWHQVSTGNILALTFSHFLSNFFISFMNANLFNLNLLSTFFSFFFLEWTLHNFNNDNRKGGNEGNKTYK